VLFENSSRRVLLIVSDGECVGAMFWSGKRRVHPVKDGKRLEDVLEYAKIKDFDDDSNPAIANIAAFLHVESLSDAHMEELGYRACPWRRNCYALGVPWKEAGYAVSTFAIL